MGLGGCLEEGAKGRQTLTLRSLDALCSRQQTLCGLKTEGCTNLGTTRQDPSGLPR